MQVRGLLNYRLKHCWPKMIWCICQPNEIEREIKKKLGGQAKSGRAMAHPGPLRIATVPCWFLVSGKPTAWLFKFTRSRGSNKKVRDVLVAYLLCRYKHLSVLFRVVSLSKTKKVYIMHIAGYNINFIIYDFSDVKDISFFTSRFSSGFILLEYIKGLKR